MQNKYFRAKPLIYFLIWTFLLLITSESIPVYGKEVPKSNTRPVIRIKAGHGLTAAQREQFENHMEEGKRLYGDMDHEGAIKRFQQAGLLARTKEQRSDVYLYLSLSNYSLMSRGRSSEFTDTLDKLIEVDYYLQLDPELCPQRFIDMFEQSKRNFGVIKIHSLPAGAEVFINNSRTSVGLTPLTLAAKAGQVRLEMRKGKKKKKTTIQVDAGKEVQSPVYELKGGKTSLLWILGGVLAVGGLGAALALGGGGNGGSGSNGVGGGGGTVITTGTVQISSNPSGALALLDGAEKGTTPVTITDVPAGSHTVQIMKEGYLDHQESVTVTAGQTSTVNATLGKHVITFVSPLKNSECMVGDDLQIQWELDQSSQGQYRNPVQNFLKSSAPYTMPAQTNINSSVTSDLRSDIEHGSGILRTQATRRSSHRIAASSSRSSAAHARRFFNSPMVGSTHRNNGHLQRQIPEALIQGEAEAQRLATVKLVLLESGNYNRTIVSSTENDGLFEWNIPKNLTPGGDFRIRISCTENEDVSYNSERFSILGDELRFILSKDEVIVPEGGTAGFRVKLSTRPKADVVASVRHSSGDGDLSIKSGESFVFTESNWNTYHKVILECAVDGDAADGEAVFRISAAGIPGRAIVATEHDTIVPTPPKPPVAPTNLSAAHPVEIGHPQYQVALSWEDNSNDESGFKVQRRDRTPEFSDFVTLPPNTTSYIDSDFDDEGFYAYRIVAFNSDGDSEFSNEDYVHVIYPPYNLLAQEITGPAVRLGWSYGADYEWFSVERKVNDGEWAVIEFDPMFLISGHMYDTTVSSGNTYSYRVRCEVTYNDETWHSSYSNTVSITIGATLPEAPTNLSAAHPVETGYHQYQVALSWEDNSNNESGFRVQRNSSHIAILPPNTTSYTDTDFDNEGQYSYRVVAFNSDGDSDYSNSVLVHVIYPPENLTAQELAGPTVRLDWQYGTEYEWFSIERKVEGGEWTVIEENIMTFLQGYYDDTTVSAGNTYSYRVRCVNGTFYSPYSNTVSITLD